MTTTDPLLARAIVASVPVGSRLLDTVYAPITPMLCASWRDTDKVDGLILYLGGNCTAAAVANALGAGLGVMGVTFSREPGWDPAVCNGTADGQLDVSHARGAGLAQQTTIWTDLEGCAGVAAATSMYLNDRSKEQLAFTAAPGLYAGAETGGLDAEGLYELPYYRHYWDSLSHAPPYTVTRRGFGMYQLYPSVMRSGVLVDLSFVQQDHLGSVPLWTVAA